MKRKRNLSPAIRPESITGSLQTEGHTEETVETTNVRKPVLENTYTQFSASLGAGYFPKAASTVKADLLENSRHPRNQARMYCSATTSKEEESGANELLICAPHRVTTLTGERLDPGPPLTYALPRRRGLLPPRSRCPRVYDGRSVWTANYAVPPSEWRALAVCYDCRLRLLRVFTGRRGCAPPGRHHGHNVHPLPAPAIPRNAIFLSNYAPHKDDGMSLATACKLPPQPRQKATTTCCAVNRARSETHWAKLPARRRANSPIVTLRRIVSRPGGATNFLPSLPSPCGVAMDAVEHDALS